MSKYRKSRRRSKRTFNKSEAVALLMLLLVIGVGGMIKDKISPSTPSMKTVYTTPTFITKSLPTTTPRPEVTPKPASTSKPTATIKVSAASNEETYVYISASGSKYHKKSNCSNMKSATKITLKTAKQRGYQPCSKCY